MEGIDGNHFVDKLLQLPHAKRLSRNSKKKLTLYASKRYKRPLMV